MTTLAPPHTRRIPHRQTRILLPTNYRMAVTWTAWVFACTVPMLNTVALPGVGTVSRAAGVTFAGAGAIALLAASDRRRLHDAHWLALALLGWSALSVTWSVDPGATQRTAFTLAQVVLAFVLVWEFCPTRGGIRGLLRAFVVGAMTLAVQLLDGAFTTVEDPTRYSVGDAHPNSLAFVVSLALPMAWYLAVTSSSRLERVVMRLVPVVGIVTIVLTASRSALLVAGAALLIVPATAGQVRARGRLVGMVAVVVGVVLALALAPAKPLDRLGTTTQEVESADLSGRGALWEASAHVLARAPYLGVGLGATSTMLEREIGEDRGAHNTFLAVAVEVGVPGLLLFLLLLVASLLPTLRARGPDGALVRVLALTLVLGLMPRHWHLEKTTWLVLAMIIGMVAATGDRPGQEETEWSTTTTT